MRSSGDGLKMLTFPAELAAKKFDLEIETKKINKKDKEKKEAINDQYEEEEKEEEKEYLKENLKTKKKARKQSVLISKLMYKRLIILTTTKNSFSRCNKKKVA
jgi:3-hydroxy-3-methylglutaryl CoA synthase